MAARWIEQKRHYRQYKARIEQLPVSYRTAVAALERYTNYLGGLGDGDSILSMLDDLADLFEQGAADGTPVREIVGRTGGVRRGVPSQLPGGSVDHPGTGPADPLHRARRRRGHRRPREVPMISKREPRLLR
jgi:hypothetical protein